MLLEEEDEEEEDAKRAVRPENRRPTLLVSFCVCGMM